MAAGLDGARAVAVELHLATAWSSAEREKTLPAQAVEAQLAAAHAHGLHDRVGGQQAVAEVGEEALQRVAVVAERLAQDEVLHRVGGDDGGVVAFRVGGAKLSPSTSTSTSQANRSSPAIRCTGTRSLP